ncbi:uncharacterized protein [Diadema setosum]|uniref:uncharacterized protein n=1 Tax=Diadema setosum TaxID=31175 RepID=UPI003B3AE6BA
MVANICIREPCEHGNTYCLFQPVSISHKFIDLPGAFPADTVIYRIQTKDNPKYDYFYRMPRGNRSKAFKLEQQGSKASVRVVRSMVGPLEFEIFVYMEVYLKGTSTLVGEYMTKLFVDISPHPFPFQ